jgi:hypothetical protein
VAAAPGASGDAVLSHLSAQLSAFKLPRSVELTAAGAP